MSETKNETLKGTARLSQHTAILLEHARSQGITDSVILAAAHSGDAGALASAEEEHYRYDDFLSYAAEHGESLERAVQYGYRITFNTRNGLKIWLEQTFGLRSGQDFEVGEGIVTGLSLDENGVKLLESRLAPNWRIAEKRFREKGCELTLKLTALA
ncbi:hypothetical protein QWJ34_11535 [Saccharibacillus sp. CPCC 101409]|uniref:hypothetical protein n=1 Tax=Saccharibacillus sp. CPCC 101409 TaxID=3058041 RepID=UPI002673D384|nr:hypothetical protein [Saccharibacillus sp. CPCC 101409]MDO3410395.1 hypothetical protein [Saccharibacillus sp. CPCC 101409]